MSIDAVLKETLESITPSIPALNGIFVPPEDVPEYYVFTDATIPTNFADDAPRAERHLLTVHLFAPLDVNVTERKAKTKLALFNAGFTWPSVEPDSDANYRHLIFSFETADGVDYGEHND